MSSEILNHDLAEISVITRFHDDRYVDYLCDAGNSLRAQTLERLEWVVVTKNFSPTQLQALETALADLASPRLRLKIINHEVPAGVDGRSALLNRGLAAASGRYLLFLDYDDVLLPPHCVGLIEALRGSGAVLAAGGCEQVLVDSVSRRKLKTLRIFNRGHRLAMFWNNFLPIHSFVLDRERVPPKELYFDEGLDRCEDYDFLVRVSATGGMDLTHLGRMTCVYRIRNDDSNTSLEGRRKSTEAEERAWGRAVAMIAERKKGIEIRVSAAELSDFYSYVSDISRDRSMSFKERVKARLKSTPLLFNMARRIYLLGSGGPRRENTAKL